ncbi:MAG: hypothetical protein Q9170_002387 [Blastenia crenularia]
MNLHNSITSFSLLLLYLNPHTALAAYGSGSVSLWSNSDCARGDTLAFTTPVVIALNYTLPADQCHSLDRAAHSYIVDSRPVCTDGNVADFAYFSGQDCQEGSSDDGAGPAYSGDNPGGLTTGGFSLDDECLALVEFNSFAFVCEGVGKGDESATSKTAAQPSSSAATASETTAVEATPTATPIVPLTSLTSPLYTFSGVSGATGTASGIPLPTTGLVPPPAPSPFTGASSTIMVPVVGLLFAIFLARLV